MKTFLILFFVLGASLLAADVVMPELRTNLGQVFKQVRVTKVDAAGIRFIHVDGIASLPLSMLPDVVLKNLGVSVNLSAERQAIEKPVQENAMNKEVTQMASTQVSAEQQERRAAHYAKKTGQPLDLCLQAVRVGDWCVAHKQGGTGLDGKYYDAKASADQLHLAMQILGMIPADDSPQVAAHADPGVPVAGAAIAAGRRVIESSIDGEFEGFEGDKVFKLLNGQVWEQTEFYYHYHYAYGPRVMIYVSDGGWMMKVDGVEKAVRVMQLR